MKMLRRASIMPNLCTGRCLDPYVSSVNVHCCRTSSNTTSQNLPRLPVPKLEDTLAKYLITVKPFLNENEFRKTSNIVNKFIQDGTGTQLQSLLENRAQKHSNWLADWWLSTAYLEFRNPVVLYSSPGLVFPFRKFENQMEQLKYTAKTLRAVTQYKEMIDKDKIPLEKMGNKPLDMSQYKKVFGTCRLPIKNKDQLSYNPTSKHVVVMYNNQAFRLDLWGGDNLPLTEAQMVEQLQVIMRAGNAQQGPGVGILTSEQRDTWAEAYQLLLADNVNKESLECIERSLAVVCLDAPVGLWGLPSKDAKQTLAGGQTIHGGGSKSNGSNRWFDKTIQFIVGADGVTGLTYEHSPAEGQPIAVLTDFIIDYIDKNENKDGNLGCSTSTVFPNKPKLLKFNVNDDVKKYIEQAKCNLDRLVEDLDLNCFTYEKYGKEFIKRQKMSPDSYLQMAMQFAFYSLHNEPAAHYESAATRMYEGGRTEVIRSCSVESVQFAKAMANPGLPPKEKSAVMRKAVDGHKAYTVQAIQGLGVDRHLLGLKLIAIENNLAVPELFDDVGFKRSTHMRLSTSQVACRCDGFMVYGPLVQDGYATCYNPRELDINFGTSAFACNSVTDITQYRRSLEKALDEMHDVLCLTVPSKL